MHPSVKHARNRPLGANFIWTMGERMRSSQLTSVMVPREDASHMMTELEVVPRKTSGCRRGVWMRGRTARDV